MLGVQFQRLDYSANCRRLLRSGGQASWVLGFLPHHRCHHCCGFGSPRSPRVVFLFCSCSSFLQYSAGFPKVGILAGLFGNVGIVGDHIEHGARPKCTRTVRNTGSLHENQTSVSMEQNDFGKENFKVLIWIV